MVLSLSSLHFFRPLIAHRIPALEELKVVNQWASRSKTKTNTTEKNNNTNRTLTERFCAAGLCATLAYGNVPGYSRSVAPHLALAVVNLCAPQVACPAVGR